MKITLYGASGMIGSRILDEALRRGHTVTAVVRDSAKIAERPNLTVVAGDATDASSVAATAAAVDVGSTLLAEAVDPAVARMSRTSTRLYHVSRVESCARSSMV